MKKDNQNITIYYALLTLSIAGVVLSAFLGQIFGILAMGLMAILLVLTRSSLVPGNNSGQIEGLDSVDIGDIRVPANMPMPYAVLSKEGGILRYNRAFQELCGDFELRNTVIEDWLPEYELGLEQQELQDGEHMYRVYTKTIPVTKDGKATGNEVDTLCFVDVSATGKLKQTIENQKTAVGLIYIDNYDEVVSVMEDSKLPLITALIDRKLSALFAEYGGVLKKLEKDRYICLLSRKALEQMKEGKFEILNDIKSVKVGEHIPATLSLGFGISDVSLETAMKDARSALDLALGRGGDQALVKEKGKTLFFGGKSGEVAHNARVRARIKAEAFMELLAEADKVYVMGHKNADLDSLGSSLGVYRMARSVNKPCHILMESNSGGVRRLCQRIAAQEEYKNLFLSKEAAHSGITEHTLTVVVDTHIPELVESPLVVETCRRVVVLDHHRKSTSFIDKAVLVYHEPYASSTSELVTEMIQYQGERVKLTKLEADALLGGMTVDTRNFSGKTGAITFETAAYLKRNGADSTRVRLLLQNNMEEYKAKARAVEQAEFLDGQIALAVCDADVSGTTVMAAQTADDLLDVEGVKASFVLCSIEDTVYVSARSLGEINVQTLMEKLGGGGHQTVAGAQFAGETIETVKEKILAVIAEK